MERVVVLIDMDCFFCQVEAKLNPQLAGKPVAVVQYNLWGGGGIIAVNYEARDFGVTRHMRGDEAKEKCPDIALPVVPALRGKADTTRYRTAGREVIDVLKTHCDMIERASVDEAYLDITSLVEKRDTPESYRELAEILSNSHVIGETHSFTNDEEMRKDSLEQWLSSLDEGVDEAAKKLAIGAAIVEDIRLDVFNKTGYRCSAGISYNKILAKLACGLHKPNRQTILPNSAVPQLFASLPVKKVRNLGGKFGDIVVDSLGCNVMGDLMRFSLAQLQSRFDEKTGFWLHNIARGIDNEPVTPRLLAKSIGACKQFPGRQAISNFEVVTKWLTELSTEVCERLDADRNENKRRATLLTIGYSYHIDDRVTAKTRSLPLSSPDIERIASQAVEVVKKARGPITNLSVTVSKFVDINRSGSIANFFKSSANDEKASCSNDTRETESREENVDEETSEVASSCALQSTEEERNVDCSVSVESPVTNSIRLSEEESQDNSNTNDVEVKPVDSVDSPASKTENVASDESTEYNVRLSQLTKEQRNEIKRRKAKFFNMRRKSDDKKTKDAKDDLRRSFFGFGISESILESPDEPKSFFLSTTDEAQETEEEPAGSEELMSDGSTTSNEPSTSRFNRQPPESREKVKLSDIFPDLTNIDHEILAILPLELQKEARALMNGRKQERKPAATVKTPSKNVKKRVNAGKSLGKREVKKKKINAISNIDSFLITRADESENMMKCDECGQMICEFKQMEHKDFHLARNLQISMNKSEMKNAKRKHEESPQKEVKKKFFQVNS